MSVLFLFFWIVVVVLEKKLTAKRAVDVREEKGGLAETENETISIIMTGIKAYEEDKKGVLRRMAGKEKEERVSWWRVSARTR